MKSLLHRSGWVVAALTGLLLAVIVGIWSQPVGVADPDAATIATIRRLEQVWTSYPDRHAGKTEYGIACGALRNAIARCTQEELRGIVRYNVAEFTVAPTAQRRNDFEEGFLSTLEWLCIDVLIAAQDREQLLFVLTWVPHDRLGFSAIESALGYDFSIAYAEGEPWKPNPLITVLFDAYEQAQTPGARDAVLAAIQRSFREQPGDPEGGSLYVAQCREWFHEHFDHIEAMKDHVHVYGDEPWQQVGPLYVVRAAR
jgi:hypothetical protein